MHRHTALIVVSLLALACGPGPGGTSDSDSASTTGTTDVDTTTETASTSGSSTTDATTETPTTSDTGDTMEGGTSVESTGSSVCEGLAGSEDCALLVEASPDLTLEECMKCQGAPCGQSETCDAQYPCVDGSIVLRGCCTDDQCSGLTPTCGMFLGTNNVCVLNDDM